MDSRADRTYSGNVPGETHSFGVGTAFVGSLLDMGGAGIIRAGSIEAGGVILFIGLLATAAGVRLARNNI